MRGGKPQELKKPRSMSIRSLELAGIALLIAAAPAMGGNWASHSSQQPGACGYYTNSLGHQVPRPCGDWRTNQETTPGGATALCEDGSYSYSEHPHTPGTCSYHGGVFQRLQHLDAFREPNIYEVGMVASVLAFTAITLWLRRSRAKALRVFCGTAIATAVIMHFLTGR
jgi:hypothetical protein